MKVVFMGTPDFAVASLDAIFSAGHDIVGVFTQTDKLVGRKQILTPPAVKARALELNIPVWQPVTLRDGEALKIIERLSPDVIVVAAYGKFLPASILNFPKYGCINVHGSLLPKYRGASPIQWSIVCGESQTGITTMYMDEGMDTGDMLEHIATDILPEDNFCTLHDRLALLGAKIICSTLQKLQDGTAVRTKQDEALATYAPIIKKEMGLIDFNKTATEIFNLVRAFDPWPSAFTFLGEKRFKIISASVCDTIHSTQPGTLIDNEGRIVVAAGEGSSVVLNTVQLEGSKSMSGAEFLKGRRLEKGMKFGG